MTAEKNKETAYTSVGFKNWKKAPEFFKDNRNSKCHKEVATLAVWTKYDERYQFGRFTEVDFI